MTTHKKIRCHDTNIICLIVWSFVVLIVAFAWLIGSGEFHLS